MRKGKRNSNFSVHAIAGIHVVTLCFDSIQEYAKDLLGFAIHRKEYKGNHTIEEYWLKGLKPFKEVVNNPVHGVRYTTYEHPIQSFTWGDFTVKPGTTYEYNVVPVKGKPKKLIYCEDLSIKITTERLEDNLHEIHFNRAAAASQAYADKFGGIKPTDKTLSTTEIWKRKKWLSRGLYEAICDFISRALKDGFKLRAALYEIDCQDILKEFKKVADKGRDKLQIIYEARKGKKQSEDNEKALSDAGFQPDDKTVTFARKNTVGIPHNKFIILLKDDKPVMVWTGSTNLSEGGIFGHANVGHCIKDHKLAEEYLRYWELLKGDPDRGALSKNVCKIWPDLTDISTLNPGEMKVIFSPRKGFKMLDLYADTFGMAGKMANITFPFNLDKRFIKKIEDSTAALRYVILNSGKKNVELAKKIDPDPDVVITPGSKIDKGWHQWLNEIHSGLNGSNVLYIHTKFLLKDPLGEKPYVITGSANFSESSTNKNDENMVIIACRNEKGKTRVQDIYLGEFFRLFDHMYFRYLLSMFNSDKQSDKDHCYLKSIPGSWTKSYFNPKTDKYKRRKIFGLKPSFNEA